MRTKYFNLRQHVVNGILICWFIVGIVTQDIFTTLTPIMIFLVLFSILVAKNYDVYSHPVAMQRNNVGVKYLQSNEFDKAIDCFNDAISQYPNFASAYGNRAIAWLSKDNADKAIQDTMTAIQLSPQSGTAYGVRASAYYQKGEYQKALIDCDRASKLNHRLSFVYTILGRVYLAQNQTEDAIAAFKRAISSAKRWVELTAALLMLIFKQEI